MNTEQANPEPDETASNEDAVAGEGAAKQWFVLKVQSNRERSIRESILRRIKM